MSQGGISVSVFVRQPPYLYPPGSVNGLIRIRYSDEYPYLVVPLPPSGRAAHHVLHVLGAFADDAPVAEGRLRAKVGI